MNSVRDPKRVHAIDRLHRIQQHLTASAQAQTPEPEYASTCFFPSNFYLDVPVISVKQETSTTKIITFGLPKGKSLQHPVSSCIMMQGHDSAAKPFNPITPPDQIGSFSLCIKIYADTGELSGAVSRFAGELTVGDSVGFCQFKGNIKPFQYPFDHVKKITMLCTGTGVTPHFQALLPLLRTKGETTEIRLLYSNLSSDDIPLKKELISLQASSQGRLKVTFVVEQSTRDAGWYETGRIDTDIITRFAFAANELNSVVWVCGVPKFYEAMAGSRFDPMASDCVLAKLGYTESQLWRS